jgi:hypothetical protein
MTQAAVQRAGSDGGITAAPSDSVSTAPAPVVFRLEVAGDCYRLVECTEASPPEMSCPSTTRATPILPYETRTSGETVGEVLRLGDGYRLDSIRLRPISDSRSSRAAGSWRRGSRTERPLLG